jgi:hypothetical protein
MIGKPYDPFPSPPSKNFDPNLLPSLKDTLMVVNDLVQTAHGAEYTVSQFNLDFFIANPPPAFSGKKKSTSSCYF